MSQDVVRGLSESRRKTDNGSVDPLANLKIIRISYQFLEDFLKGELPKFKTNAPKDLEILRIQDYGIETVKLLCRSESFREVPAGSPIGYFEVICTATS